MVRGNTLWNKALKKWNEGKDGFCIPKKGSKGHEEVKELQRSLERKRSAPENSSQTRRIKRKLNDE